MRTSLFRDIWEEDTIRNDYGVTQIRWKNIGLVRVALDEGQMLVFANAVMNFRKISWLHESHLTSQARVCSKELFSQYEQCQTGGTNRYHTLDTRQTEQI
jgi:hypothetical protein